MIPRLFLVICASLALAGCWLSDRDLFAGQYLSDSGFEGEYTYNFNELNPARRVTISYAGQGMLEMYQHDAVNYPATSDYLETVDLGDGYFLAAQAVDRQPYIRGYSLLRRRDDGAVVQYRAPCENWIATQAGVSRDPGNEDVCAFRSFTALEAVALSMIARGTLVPQNVFEPVE